MPDVIDLQQRIARVVAEKMHLTPPPAEANLFEAGCLDSLSFVSLLVCIEEEFGLRIDLKDLDLGKFQSIAGIASFVASLEPVPVQTPAPVQDRSGEVLLAARELAWGYPG